MRPAQKRKFGFFTSLALMVGSIVGIGVFFKNHSIQQNVDNNGYAWVAAWLIIGVLSIAMAVVYSEISKTKTKHKSGLVGWTDLVTNKRFTYFNQFNYNFFYFGIYATIFGYIFSESLFQVLVVTGAMSQQPPLYFHVIIGWVVIISSYFLCSQSEQAVNRLQATANLIKFIPLVAVIVIAVVLLNHHYLADKTNPVTNSFQVTHFNAFGLIATLPAVMFSYDAFINVGSLTKKIKNGEKAISKIVFMGMIIVIILYFGVAVSAALHNQGRVDNLLKDALGNKGSVSQAIEIIIWISITFASYALINANILVFHQNMKEANADRVFFFSYALNYKWKSKTSTMVSTYMIMVVWLSVTTILTLVFNSDAYLDGITNYGVLFYFPIYAYVVFCYAKKRQQFANIKQMKKPLLFFLVAISSIMVLAITLFDLFWVQTLAVFLAPDQTVTWGLYDTNNYITPNIARFTLFVVMTFVFFTMPYLNVWLRKRLLWHHKRNYWNNAYDYQTLLWKTNHPTTLFLNPQPKQLFTKDTFFITRMF